MGRNASSFLEALSNCSSITVRKPVRNFLLATIFDGAVSLPLAADKFGLPHSRMCSTWDLYHGFMISAAHMALRAFAPNFYMPGSSESQCTRPLSNGSGPNSANTALPEQCCRSVPWT